MQRKVWRLHRKKLDDLAPPSQMARQLCFRWVEPPTADAVEDSCSDGRYGERQGKKKIQKFSLRHEIIGHREMLVDWIADRKMFNEGEPQLRLPSQLSIRCRNEQLLRPLTSAPRRP